MSLREPVRRSMNALEAIRVRGREIVLIIAVTLLTFTAAPMRADPADGLNRIAHMVVIFQENWSFDSLYGSVPDTNGLARASSGDAAGRPTIARSNVGRSTIQQGIATCLYTVWIHDFGGMGFISEMRLPNLHKHMLG